MKKLIEVLAVVMAGCVMIAISLVFGLGGSFTLGVVVGFGFLLGQTLSSEEK